MQRRFTILLSLLILLLLSAVSCQDSPDGSGFDLEQQSDETAAAPVDVPFRISKSRMTKSSITAGEDNVSCVTVAAYSGGILCKSLYTETDEELKLRLLPSISYNLYALANVGPFHIPQSEEEFLEYEYSIDSVGDLDKGLPMCWSYKDFTVTAFGDPVEISLERLVSKVTLSMTAAPEIRGCSVTAARLCQAASAVRPFAEGGSKALGGGGGGHTISGDYASEEDLATLNGGGSISFYTLENRQGTLLPGNTDPKEKVPENIPGKSGVCTYIEITCLHDGSILDGEVIYRIFPGEDNCSNFDLIRNRNYNIDLSYSYSGMGELSWKVDMEDCDIITAGTARIEDGYSEDNLKVGDKVRIFVAPYPFSDVEKIVLVKDGNESGAATFSAPVSITGEKDPKTGLSFNLTTEMTCVSKIENAELYAMAGGKLKGKLPFTSGKLLTISPKYQYLTFTSDGDQTISVKNTIFANQSGTIYYSTDRKIWKELSTNPVSFNGNIYVNGENTIGYNFVFGTDAKVACTGNVMTLIDRENPENATLSDYQFHCLFYHCTQLTSAPSLPATTMAKCCYASMFNGCTGLTSAPVLPATALAEGCYANMFTSCTGLTSGPALPVTTLAHSCYGYMFDKCTGLISAPELPATALTPYCYLCMFYGCTSLKSAPTLPAKTLTEGCYNDMFHSCTGLTAAPKLPAMTLARYCYCGMFSGCTSLTTAPDLPVKILKEACYCGMFWNCSKLSYIKMLATDISADGALDDWVYGVASTGTFVKKASTSIPVGISGIPTGWTVQNDDIEYQYLTFTSDGDQTIHVVKKGISSGTIYYSTDRKIWQELSSTPVSFNGNIYVNGDNAIGYIFVFGTDAKVACTGNVMTLVDRVNPENATLSKGQFDNLFFNCHQLTSAPELPAPVLAERCYDGMFFGCTGLKYAPALPATILAKECYASMFEDCTGLIAAPALPATTLPEHCYIGMFRGCTSLTSAPALPATTLATSCYICMFEDCTSLKSAPALPATTLAPACYSCMFGGCTSLISVPELNAVALALGCYHFMFYGCSGLASPPKLPAEVLADSCYRGMFLNCTGLKSAPALPVTNLASYCYERMFYGCTSLVSAPVLPATILAPNCYQNMFSGCSKLSYIKMLATDISADRALDGWVYGVASTGTFVKNASASIPVGISGIPTGWTVQNDGEETDLSALQRVRPSER